jgi:hypothetical protein
MFKPASYIPKLFNPLPKVDPSPCLEQFMSTHLDKYCAEINDAKEDADLSNIYSRVSNLLVQNFLKQNPIPKLLDSIVNAVSPTELRDIKSKDVDGQLSHVLDKSRDIVSSYAIGRVLTGRIDESNDISFITEKANEGVIAHVNESMALILARLNAPPRPLTSVFRLEKRWLPARLKLTPVCKLINDTPICIDRSSELFKPYRDASDILVQKFLNKVPLPELLTIISNSFNDSDRIQFESARSFSKWTHLQTKITGILEDDLLEKVVKNKIRDDNKKELVIGLASDSMIEQFETHFKALII